MSGDTVLRYAVYAGALGLVCWAVAVCSLTARVVVRHLATPPWRRAGNADPGRPRHREERPAPVIRIRVPPVSPGATADPGDGRGSARGLSSTPAPPCH